MAYDPTIDRTTLFEGPAHIIFDKTGSKSAWKYCFCAGDVTLNLLRTPKDIPVSGFGTIDDPAADETIEIDFEPAGHLSADLFNWLFGALTKSPGQSLFGAADTPLHIHGLDGTLIAVKCAAVTQPPAIRFGAGLARFSGTAKAVGVIGKSVPRSTATCLWEALASETFTAVPDPAAWTHLPVQATWALSAPLTILPDSDGWTLTSGATVTPRVSPDLGTFDFRVDRQAVEASCRPLNISDATLLSAALAGSSRRIGASTPSADLTLAEDHPGLTAILRGARLTAQPAVFAEGKPRAGTLVWAARHGANGLFTVAPTAAPEG